MSPSLSAEGGAKKREATPSPAAESSASLRRGKRRRTAEGPPPAPPLFASGSAPPAAAIPEHKEGGKEAEKDGGTDGDVGMPGASRDARAPTPRARFQYRDGLSIATSWGIVSGFPCRACFAAAAKVEPSAEQVLDFSCPPGADNSAKCGGASCNEGRCVPLPGLMAGDFSIVVGWATMVEDMCQGPLVSSPVGRVDARTAVLAAANVLALVEVEHSKLWGLTDLQDKAARRDYQALVIAARGALRGRADPNILVLPRLEPGDEFFSRVHEALATFRDTMLRYVMPRMTPEKWDRYGPCMVF